MPELDKRVSISAWSLMRTKLKDDPRVIKEKEKGIIAIIIGKNTTIYIQWAIILSAQGDHDIKFYRAYRCLMLLRIHAFPTACLIRNNFPGEKMHCRGSYFSQTLEEVTAFITREETLIGDNFTFSRSATKNMGWHRARASERVVVVVVDGVENAWKPRMIFLGIPCANGTNWRRT